MHLDQTRTKRNTKVFPSESRQTLLQSGSSTGIEVQLVVVGNEYTKSSINPR